MLFYYYTSFYHPLPRILKKLKRKSIHWERRENLWLFIKLIIYKVKQKVGIIFSKTKIAKTVISLIFFKNSNCIFFPSTAAAFEIFVSLAATSYTPESLFSILRRVNTMLRSMMNEERPSGLCLLSVHREQIHLKKNKFI